MPPPFALKVLDHLEFCPALHVNVRGSPISYIYFFEWQGRYGLSIISCSSMVRASFILIRHPSQ